MSVRIKAQPILLRGRNAHHVESRRLIGDAVFRREEHFVAWIATALRCRNRPGHRRRRDPCAQSLPRQVLETSSQGCCSAAHRCCRRRWSCCPQDRAARSRHWSKRCPGSRRPPVATSSKAAKTPAATNEKLDSPRHRASSAGSQRLFRISKPRFLPTENAQRNQAQATSGMRYRAQAPRLPARAAAPGAGGQIEDD